MGNAASPRIKLVRIAGCTRWRIVKRVVRRGVAINELLLRCSSSVTRKHATH